MLSDLNGLDKFSIFGTSRICVDFRIFLWIPYIFGKSASPNANLIDLILLIRLLINDYGLISFPLFGKYPWWFCTFSLCYIRCWRHEEHLGKFECRIHKSRFIIYTFCEVFLMVFLVPWVWVWVFEWTFVIREIVNDYTECVICKTKESRQGRLLGWTRVTATKIDSELKFCISLKVLIFLFSNGSFHLCVASQT